MIKPYISTANLRDALSSMQYARPAKDMDGFYHLTLVERFLNDPQLPNAESLRQYALSAILSELITDGLSTLRRAFDLPPPDAATSRAEALDAIALDASQQSAELLGWSLLYFRYVRVDLDMSPVDASAVIHLEDRSLRRYQSIATERLRDTLVTAEWQARRELHQLRLNAMIPAFVPDILYGRDQIVHLALGPAAPRHMLFTGANGIGKTSLVGTLVMQRIAQDSIEQLVWLDKPESLRFVRQYLRQEMPEDSLLSIKQWTLLSHVTIVLDNIQFLLNEIAALRDLLAELSEANVYMTNLYYAAISSDCAHFALSGLDTAATAALVRALRSDHAEHSLNNFTESLLDRVGGNPWIIRTAANSAINLDIDEPLLDTEAIYRLFRQIFAMLTNRTQNLLLKIALMPQLVLNRSDLEAIWPENPPAEAQILELLSCSLIANRADLGGFVLDGAMHDQIRRLYVEDEASCAQIDQLVASINRQSRAALALIEHWLHGNWPPLDSKMRRDIVGHFAKKGVEAGHFATWVLVLAELSSRDYELQILYAVCLRHLAEYATAAAVLEPIIAETGRKGDFERQSWALVELTRVYRHMGRYEDAVWYLSQITAAENPKMVHHIATERAQIAVDQADMQKAYSILEHEPRTLHNLQMLAEISAARGLLRQSQRYIDLALREVQQPHERGRLQAALARIYARQHDYGKAESQFLSAMALLEAESDVFALARCQANFAALLIDQREDLAYAAQLLNHAEQQQVIMDDSVGLMFTRHNIQALDTILAIDGP